MGVLVHADAAASERLWLIHSMASSAEISPANPGRGLAPLSEMLSPQGNVVFIVASETAAARVEKLAAALHATVTSEPGSSGRLGSNISSGPEGERAAMPLYDAAISRFEQDRHVALGKQAFDAGSGNDATGRTCTAGKHGVQISKVKTQRIQIENPRLTLTLSFPGTWNLTTES